MDNCEFFWKSINSFSMMWGNQNALYGRQVLAVSILPSDLCLIQSRHGPQIKMGTMIIIF